MKIKVLLLSLLLALTASSPVFSDLETLTGGSVYIDSLVNTNPIGATDPVSELDDHSRGIKNVILNTFPSITGAVTATHTELNLIDGYTGTTTELNLIDGVTSTTAELNYTDVATAGTAEASKALVLDGSKGITGITSLTGTTVTGTTVNASTTLQVGGVSVTSTAAELNIVDGVTSTAAELNILDGATPTVAEVNKLDVSAEAVSNYKSGVLTFIKDGAGAESTSIDITSVVTASTFESIGATGSSATNIWTAMDSMTSDATFVKVKIVIFVSGGTTSSQYNLRVFARETGDATGASTQTQVGNARFTNQSGATEEDANIVYVDIPIDSSGRFDMTWSVSGTSPSTTVSIYFIGWGE